MKLFKPVLMAALALSSLAMPIAANAQPGPGGPPPPGPGAPPPPGWRPGPGWHHYWGPHRHHCWMGPGRHHPVRYCR